ncbi:MAG TPA: M14 family zinc carboxypeptidase, partial [Balneolaceae bacterium]|nr:M14 family zinc carboxypeptidase [Balneolaceae bacterium]
MRILKRKKQNGFLTYIGLTAVFILLVAVSARAQAPKPSDIFGFEVGADYKLAGYNQMLTYYNKLEAASDRVKKIKLGKTVDGRTQILLFISSNQNIQQLDKWRNISEKLARARIGSAEAQKLANEGKAIVWIDGGMHASELAHGQMTPELAYRVATEETPEMQHIRQNVILLLMPVMNPDGLDMVKNWYDQNLGTPYENSRTPWLWQRYVGHDNNRDWFMGNMPETRNVMKILYQKW